MRTMGFGVRKVVIDWIKKLELDKRIDRLRRRRSGGNKAAVLIAGVAGAAVAFFADPQRGRARRRQAIDQVGGRLRRSWNGVGRLREQLIAGGSGVWRKATHDPGLVIGARIGRRRSGEKDAVDDATLTSRVETEIFRQSSVPKGRVNVNVERGVVVLRGELADSNEINALETAARRVPGVLAVRNQVHLGGTSAHN